MVPSNNIFQNIGQHCNICIFEHVQIPKNKIQKTTSSWAKSRGVLGILPKTLKQQNITTSYGMRTVCDGRGSLESRNACLSTLLKFSMFVPSVLWSSAREPNSQNIATYSSLSTTLYLVSQTDHLWDAIYVWWTPCVFWHDDLRWRGWTSCTRATCAFLHQSLRIRAHISHAPSCVESVVQSVRPENCAMAQLASLLSSTHPSITGSDRSTKRIHKTLHCDAVAVLAIPSNRMITTSSWQVSVSFSAPTHLAAYYNITPPWHSGNAARRSCPRFQHRISTGLHVASIHVSPLLQSVPDLRLLVVFLLGCTLFEDLWQVCRDSDVLFSVEDIFLRG